MKTGHQFAESVEYCCSCAVDRLAIAKEFDAEMAERDAEIERLRAALLPSNAREIAARALWDATRTDGFHHGMVEWDANNGDAWKYLRQADAVLAALAIGAR